MHSVANLATLQTPLATFFPSKKAPKPSFWESPVLSRERKVLLSQRARAHLSLSLSLSLSPLSLSLSSLSLCVCSVQRAHTSLSLSLSLSASAQRTAGREEQRFNSVKHRYYVASLILHASIAEITAQLLSLSYVYLILSVDGAIIRIFFVQINILEGRAGLCLNGSRFSHYFIFIPLSDNRNSKIYQWKQFYWEFSCIKIQYVGKDRETNVIINNKCIFCIFIRRAALCAKM